MLDSASRIFIKFKHNFSDAVNPLCSINDGNEDTEHFLLFCQACDEGRCNHLNSVNTILRLYGLPYLSNENLL